jgi:hypothetical protein
VVTVCLAHCLCQLKHEPEQVLDAVITFLSQDVALKSSPQVRAAPFKFILDSELVIIILVDFIIEKVLIVLDLVDPSF